MYSCGPLYMDEKRQDVQLEPTYSGSVPILDVALRTCQKQWMIGRGGERGSEISMLIVWHDDVESRQADRQSSDIYVKLIHIIPNKSKCNGKQSIIILLPYTNLGTM